jgi:hypothetical protein
MNHPKLILQTLVITAIVTIAAACSSEENSSEKVKADAEVFKGYTDALDKAENVEQTLMQADKRRREEMEKNY